MEDKLSRELLKVYEGKPVRDEYKGQYDIEEVLLSEEDTIEICTEITVTMSICIDLDEDCISDISISFRTSCWGDSGLGEEDPEEYWDYGECYDAAEKFIKGVIRKEKAPRSSGEIYGIYTHEFDLPDATTDQYSLQVFDSKRAMVQALAQVFEDSLETLENLDGDEAREEAEAVLDGLKALEESAEIENTDLTEMAWEAGSLSVRVLMAEKHPKAVPVFKELIQELAEDVFSEYEDIDEDEAEDYEDDENYALYKELGRLRRNSSEKKFKSVFLAAADACGEWGTF